MSVANVAALSPQVITAEVQPNKVLKQPEIAAGQQKEEPKKTKPRVESAAADLQRLGSAFNRRLQFKVDHDSNEVIIKVIDKHTDKVIKELPPEELQRMHKSLRETIGNLFDESV